MSRVKVVRRLLFVVGALIAAFYFRYSVLSVFLDTEVAGRKYIGLFVDGGQTNGFSYLVFNYPYLQLEEDGAASWNGCGRLSHSLEGYLRNFVKGWKTNANYMFVSESNPHGYKAYIRVDERVVFVRGFPDFGGSPPDEQEKKICESPR